MTESKKKPLAILLTGPRGFCAGVDRAIQIVERAVERYGRPVYVRHEIVHNRIVVENLEAKGAIFVDELDAGVPAPELLDDELIAACRERDDASVEEVRTTDESVVFKLPRQLVA